MVGADFTEEVQAQEEEKYHPNSNEACAGDDAPAKVCIHVVQELHGKGQHHEGKYHFYNVQPTAGTGHFAHHAREEREEDKRQGEGQSKNSHTQDRFQGNTVNHSSCQDGTYERTGAGERDDDHRQRHKEGCEITAFVGLTVGFVGQTGGQGDFESAEEGDGEHQEQQGKQQVGNPVCTQGIGRCRTLEQGNDEAEGRINQGYGKSENQSFDRTALLGTVADEEADGHRNHREDAGSNDATEAGSKGNQQEHPQTLVGAFVGLLGLYRGCRCLFGGFDLEVDIVFGSQTFFSVAGLVGNGCFNDKGFVGQGTNLLEEDRLSFKNLDLQAEASIEFFPGRVLSLDTIHYFVICGGGEAQGKGHGAVGNQFRAVHIPSRFEGHVDGQVNGSICLYFCRVGHKTRLLLCFQCHVGPAEEAYNQAHQKGEVSFHQSGCYSFGGKCSESI